MGNTLLSMMDRKNAATLEPHPLVHKFWNYGVNNETFSAPTDTCSAVYRMKHFEDDVFFRLCDHYYHGIGNTVSNLKELCAKRGDGAAALAYRRVLRIEQVEVPDPTPSSTPTTTQLPTKPRTVTRNITHYGPRETISYTEFWRMIENFGVGLRRQLNALAVSGSMHAETPITTHAAAGCLPCVRGLEYPKVAIFEETRWEWVVSIFGLWTQRLVAVTVFANLGERAVGYALQEAQCDAVICNAKNVPSVVRLMAEGLLDWAVIVYLDTLPEDYALPTHTVRLPDGKELPASDFVVSWTQMVEEGGAILRAIRTPKDGEGHAVDAANTETAAENEGEDQKKEEEKTGATSTTRAAQLAALRLTEQEADALVPTLPETNDHLALIMYTSGTTGNPKGVMHTQGSIISAVESLNDKLIWVEPYLPKGVENAYCAFLPLAHIMEFICINIFLKRGFVVGFGNPRTLTDEFSRPHGDFHEYRPSIIMAVPRIFDVLRKSVLGRLPPEGSLKRQVFFRAYRAKLEALHRGYDTPYYNAKVFAKIREAFGGRMVLMVSGGGLLSDATQEFTHVCMGLAVQGYGLTETAACGSTQMVGSLESGNAGQLMKGCEVKLMDVEEFRHTDTPEPRGEICIRGPFLFKGYYKQPQLTAEALDEDGWFHTGDVGSISPKDGVLRIVGRVKALAKNVNGEYIALEKLEAAYSANELSLPNSTCVLVHPLRNYVCALALTDVHLVQRFLSQRPQLVKELSTTAFPEVLNDPVFQRAVTESFHETAAKAKLRHFELVRRVQLLAEEWTPENDTLTAALKIKRRVIDVTYKDTIAKLFKDG